MDQRAIPQRVGVSTLVALEAPLVAVGALTTNDSHADLQLLFALLLSGVALWLRGNSRPAFIAAFAAQAVLLSLGVVSLVNGHYFPASIMAAWVLANLIQAVRAPNTTAAAS
jgi:hypothetical protein